MAEENAAVAAVVVEAERALMITAGNSVKEDPLQIVVKRKARAKAAETKTSRIL